MSNLLKLEVDKKNCEFVIKFIEILGKNSSLRLEIRKILFLYKNNSELFSLTCKALE